MMMAIPAAGEAEEELEQDSDPAEWEASLILCFAGVLLQAAFSCWRHLDRRILFMAHN